MAKITILPLGLDIEATEGSTIMEAAWAHGLYWPTTCGGQGICTSCTCTIDAGETNLQPMGRGEHKTLATEFSEASIKRQGLRLACQARVYGDVTVHKRGVRPVSPSPLSLD